MLYGCRFFGEPICSFFHELWSSSPKQPAHFHECRVVSHKLRFCVRFCERLQWRRISLQRTGIFSLH